VRRSPRILELNDGFRNHDNCSDKNYLTCNCAPPGFKKKIVKNLTVSFCKVNDDALDKKLMKKSKSQEKGKGKFDGEPAAPKKTGRNEANLAVPPEQGGKGKEAGAASSASQSVKKKNSKS
jgi:hypothetical protein